MLGAERIPSYPPQGRAAGEQPTSQKQLKRSPSPESHQAMKGSPIEYTISIWLVRRAANDNKETQAALQAALGEVFDTVSKDLALTEVETTAIKARTITGSSLMVNTKIGDTKNATEAFEILKQSVELVAQRVIKEYRLERSKSGKR